MLENVKKEREEKQMRRIISLAVVSLVLLATAGVATWTYFTDTEQSTDNSLSAGTLDLNVDGGDTAVTTFSETGKAPGDSGSGSTTLANAGNLAGELDIAFSAITNTGGSSGEYGDSTGNLGAEAQIAVYLDINQNATFDDGDIELNTGGANAYDSGTNSSLDYADIDDYGSVSYDAVIAAMAASAADDFIVLWQIPTSSGNNIQGDSVSFDVTFTLEQAAVD
jgi:predicted ribosomally synthesized peptide with SipW-like signal peptide